MDINHHFLTLYSKKNLEHFYKKISVDFKKLVNILNSKITDLILDLIGYTTSCVLEHFQSFLSCFLAPAGDAST